MPGPIFAFLTCWSCKSKNKIRADKMHVPALTIYQLLLGKTLNGKLLGKYTMNVLMRNPTYSIR